MKFWIIITNTNNKY